MKQIIVNGWKLVITLAQNGYIAINLFEVNSWINLQNETKDWYHEDMGFASPTTKSKIKSAVEHWLSRIDSDLAKQSGKLIDDFFADADARKLSDTTLTPIVPPSNLN